MKAKKDPRKGGANAQSEQVVKGKKLIPEKKVKNEKRALFQEIEEDEDVDYLIKERESIEDYFDDESADFFDDEFDDDDE